LKHPLSATPAGLASARIRNLTHDDLPQVASLYELVARSGSRSAPPGLAAHFGRTLLDHPWADPEIPSLVCEEPDGSISGFIGCHVRRLLFDGTPIRLACGGQLVTDPEARKRAVGFFLLREFLAGSQELAITDTAVAATRVMWTRIGGQLAHLQSIGWFRLLRPVPFAVDFARSRRRRAARPRGDAGGGEWISFGLGARFRPRPAASPATTSAADLWPRELAELLPELAGGCRLRPDYDPVFLDWLFGEMRAVRTRGSLIARVVRAREGRVVGWYVYYLRRGGVSDVLQVVATPREVGRVVDDLFRHAKANGAALLRGRLEAPLVEALASRRCLFRFNGAALVHARDPDVVRALAAGEALLTRMEGEWWMGHHLEPFRDR
jgi:hypothetical protein